MPSPAPAAPIPAPTTVLLTVAQFAAQQPALTEASVRWAIFNSDDNGLARSGALVHMGRRVLLDPDRYLGWLRTSPRLSKPKPRPSRPRAVAVLDRAEVA